jgi:hypothetical protein
MTKEELIVWLKKLNWKEEAIAVENDDYNYIQDTIYAVKKYCISENHKKYNIIATNYLRQQKLKLYD